MHSKYKKSYTQIGLTWIADAYALGLFKQGNPQMRCKEVFLNRQVVVRVINFIIYSIKTEKKSLRKY